MSNEVEKIREDLLKIQKQGYSWIEQLGDLIAQGKLVEAGDTKNEGFALFDEIGRIQTTMTIPCISVPLVSAECVRLSASQASYQDGDTVAYTVTLTDLSGNTATFSSDVAVTVSYGGSTTIADDWVNNPTTFPNTVIIPAGQSSVTFGDTVASNGDVDDLIVTITTNEPTLQIKDSPVATTIGTAIQFVHQDVVDDYNGLVAQHTTFNALSGSLHWDQAINNFGPNGTLTGEQMYNMWPFITATAMMASHTPDADGCQCSLDAILEFIQAGQTNNLTGTWSESGATFTITAADNAAYLHHWWGTTDSSFSPGTYNRSHYITRAGAAMAAFLVEAKNGNMPCASQAQIDQIEAAIRNLWDLQTIGPIGTQYSNMTGERNAHYLARTAQMAVALDRCDATPGNNQYATFIQSGRWFAVVQAMAVRIANGNNNLWPFRILPDDNNFQQDTGHASDMLFALYFTEKFGYNPGGLYTQGFFNQLADNYHTVQWPQGQQSPYFYFDQTGVWTIGSFTYPLLGLNNPDLLQVWLDRYTAGGLGSNRPEWDIQALASICCALKEGPMGI